MTNDLYGEVNQTCCDKLLGSVKYPFVLFDRQESFPKTAGGADFEDGGFYQFTEQETDELFRTAVSEAGTRADATVHDQVFAFGGTILQQAKVMLDALNAKPDEFEGPSREELEAIINGGIENLGTTMRGFLSDWGVYAWCPHLRATVKSKPAIKLQSPRIDLDNVRLEFKATGELWVKYPWWNCYKWCLKWKKVIKFDRIASITVTPDIAIDAHAVFSVRGAQVFASGKFDRLRLEYDILDKIPLEGLANRAVAGKEIPIYDGAQLVATVPLLKSRFTVDKIALPPKSDAVGIGVTVRQL
ncbi:MAG: hypothetical protein QME55_00015 [Brevundimonas sp.]|uniref:hypothetical protein n=1 Tax=Brevundimonas sp. TaxID=1871086 RepID=UPI0026366F3B|nr:hypothetical protein [Brevundimonas sp.]MDI6623087.1 hypothetical protein [Brevundimonas sp.]MDQ7813479.1 hypothetical protein [Brevundimonas sp.]